VILTSALLARRIRRLAMVLEHKTLPLTSRHRAASERTVPRAVTSRGRPPGCDFKSFFNCFKFQKLFQTSKICKNL
jgi:hypothetical protein